MSKLLIVGSLVFIMLSCVSKKNIKLKSPSGNTTSTILFGENSLNLVLVLDNDTLIRNLQLKLTNDNKNLIQNIQLIERKDTKFNEVWETVNGKNKSVLNHYNGSIFKLKNTLGQVFDLEFRMYDKGFAYRFLFPEGYTNIEEKSSIHFNDNYTFWAYNGEGHNVGPIKLSEFENKRAQNPVTFKTVSQKYFAIHEAAILEHAPFSLTNIKGRIRDVWMQIRKFK